MVELNFNEEQKSLVKELLNNVEMLKEKYIGIEEGFEISITQIVDLKPFSEENESLDSIQNKIEKLRDQTNHVIRSLLGICDDLNNNKSKNTILYLDRLQWSISEAMCDLGKLEGYTFGGLQISDDISKLKKCYNKLRNKLLEETKES